MTSEQLCSANVYCTIYVAEQFAYRRQLSCCMELLATEAQSECLHALMSACGVLATRVNQGMQYASTVAIYC